MSRYRDDAIRTGYLPTDSGTPHRWLRGLEQHTQCEVCRVLRCEHDIELTASSHGMVGPGRRGYWYADPDERVFRPGAEPECRSFDVPAPTLLSCPLCGGEARVYEDSPRMYQARIYIGCPTCKGRGPKCATVDEAVEAWNRRA